MSVFDQVRDAHQALRKAVGPKRKAAHVEEGPLASSFRAAMDIWRSMDAEGVPFLERCKALERTLRAAWPKGTCRCPRCFWRCQDCQDTGAMIESRPAPIYGGRPVDVAVPCHCEKGRMFVPKQKQTADFTAAGKTSKPMTKAWER
jgi:hypothetical protein